jgi:hypothetical protein
MSRKQHSEVFAERSKGEREEETTNQGLGSSGREKGRHGIPAFSSGVD